VPFIKMDANGKALPLLSLTKPVMVFAKRMNGKNILISNIKILIVVATKIVDKKLQFSCRWICVKILTKNVEHSSDRSSVRRNDDDMKN